MVVREEDGTVGDGMIESGVESTRLLSSSLEPLERDLLLLGSLSLLPSGDGLSRSVSVLRVEGPESKAEDVSGRRVDMSSVRGVVPIRCCGSRQKTMLSAGSHAGVFWKNAPRATVQRHA